jgi:hypothetical protein
MCRGLFLFLVYFDGELMNKCRHAPKQTEDSKGPILTDSPVYRLLQILSKAVAARLAPPLRTNGEQQGSNLKEHPRNQRQTNH